MFERQSPNSILTLILLDIVGTLEALFLAYRLTTIHVGAVELPLSVIAFVMIIQGVVFLMLSVYDLRRHSRLTDEVRAVVTAVSFTLLMLAGTLYFTYRDVPRTLVAVFFALDLLLLVGWRVTARMVLRLMNRYPFGTRRVLILGSGDLATRVARAVKEYAWAGVELVGFLDDDRSFAVEDHRTLGSLDDVRSVVKNLNIDEVILALPARANDVAEKIVATLHLLPVQVRIVPSYLSLALHRATVQEFNGLPLINLRDPALTDYQRLLKRLLDLAVSSVALLLAAPIMALVAIAIRLDSPGPIIFRQTRVGEGGRPFTMLKFRSMYVDADERLKDVLQHDADGKPIHKMRNDPRVTRVGRFIRSTSLDELPQLINVLRGDMSLVGPRPELPWLVERYEPWQAKRFVVPQGITGWWQVNGRSEKLMHLHTEEDVYYIQHYSLLLDVRILFKTIPALLRRKGAF
jgi:exopolysaccharide biosynthesis polyprenyl glycosylphosphotransferase